MISTIPFVCVITDEAFCPVTQAEHALKGGASMIQLRHKSASGSQLYRWAVAINKQCQQYKALCIINDRVDIAMASNADGVHLGQEDIPAKVARKIMGNSSLIGVSTSSLEEALQAQNDGADYIGFGHIYPTSSKEKKNPPVGTGLLQQISLSIIIPIVAIGGISLQNAASIIACGAKGIAVISAVSRAENPLDATNQLVRTIKGAGV